MNCVCICVCMFQRYIIEIGVPQFPVLLLGEAYFIHSVRIILSILEY